MKIFRVVTDERKLDETNYLPDACTICDIFLGRKGLRIEVVREDGTVSAVAIADKSGNMLLKKG